MITQAIKDWVRKMFAWWPWKQSKPLEYQHVASAMTREPAPETSLWIPKEGTVPQAGVTPRRFTFENRTELLAQTHAEAADYSVFSTTPMLFVPTDGDALVEDAADTPTPQQRLEFLRYLVQRGIVNEGFENDFSDPSS